MNPLSQMPHDGYMPRPTFFEELDRSAVSPDPLAPGFSSDWEIETPYHREEDRGERYFFFAGDIPGFPAPGGMSVDSGCILMQKFLRCRITPCLTRMMRMRKGDIPEGNIIPGTLDGDFAQKWVFSGPESERLLFDYGNKLDTTRNWGLIELEELRGWTVNQVQQLNLTNYFFPDYPNIPKTNMEVLSHLEAVGEQLSYDIAVKTEHREMYKAILHRMKEAVKAAQSFQMRALDKSNTDILRPSGEPSRKEQFDPRDYLFSERTSVNLVSHRPGQSEPGLAPGVLSEILARTAQPAAPLSPEAFAEAVSAAMSNIQRREQRAAKKKGKSKPKTTSVKQEITNPEV